MLYPYSEEKRSADKKEAQRAGLFFGYGSGNGEVRYVNREEAGKLRAVMERMGYGRSSLVPVSENVWKERYTYDGNGNRKTKTTSWGKIEYEYDAENRLERMGDTERGVGYTYDGDGNLLSERSALRSLEYAYNGMGRMKRSEVVDRETNMRTITERNYDGLGRRTLVRDAGSTGMRTLYDGRSFEVIRESEVFADGSFTVNWNTGITGSPAGEESDGGRYRWIDDETNSGNLGGRYRSIDEGYGKEERYTGIKTSLYAKGEAAGVNLTGGRGNSRGGRMYLGTDIQGSVRSVSGEYGNEEARYEYDVFGAPYEGEFTQGLSGGYTGKPYDAVTGLYNYGYRDYKPESARFTTVDPIRDGSNWYSYVMNDPVNYADVWGLSASEPKQEKWYEKAGDFFNALKFDFSLDVSVGLGLSANISGLAVGLDLGSMCANFSITDGYSEIMTLGIYTLGSAEWEAPKPEDEEAAINNMELTVSIGPVSVNENEVTISFGAGFQAVLGIDFEVSVTIPLSGGKK